MTSRVIPVAPFVLISATGGRGKHVEDPTAIFSDANVDRLLSETEAVLAALCEPQGSFGPADRRQVHYRIECLRVIPDWPLLAQSRRSASPSDLVMRQLLEFFSATTRGNLTR